MTTEFNVLFNGQDSYEAGLKKIEQNFKINYSKLLPVYDIEDEAARSSAFSDMDRASVKAMKAIKLHSITAKPKRKSNNSEAYIEFRKKKEYNDLIDDCYLLNGKADYYNKRYLKADKSFKFIIRQFPHEEIVYDAHIWYARSLIEQAKYTQVKEHLRALEKKALPEKYRIDIFKLNAYYYIAIKDDAAAIENLERLVAILKKKQKAYYSYLLAQMYMKQGDNAKAMKLFSEIPKMKVSYEMSFNAKINMAISFAGAGEENLVNELFKLLKDKKNKDYKDQIYFALANIYQKKGQDEKALEYYRLSTKNSISNDVQKSTTFKVLGDYFYKKQFYEKSCLCYDSCFFYNSGEFEGSKMLTKRYNNLSVLVDNIKIVSYQDSLLRVANMSEEKRNEIIDKQIAEISKIDDIIKEDKRKSDLERSFYNKSKSSSIASASRNSGAWYFYNEAMLSAGRVDFVRKWGRRKLEDNWNRKNKAIVDDIVSDDNINLAEPKLKQDTLGNPKSRDYYLKALPMSKEAKHDADSIILESLFTMGETYSDLMNDYDNALKVYEDMLNRYPQNKYLLYIYYSNYNCSEKLGDFERQKKYKAHIINEFPDSEYAKLVQDPSYFYQMQKSLSVIDNLYEQAYFSFLRADFSDAVRICNLALSKYPNSVLKDKFMLLKIYAMGKNVSPSLLKSELKLVLESNPSIELKSIVDGILKNLNQGAEPDAIALSLASNSNNDEKIEDEVQNSLVPRYSYQPESRHYFILTFPRTGKNLNRLNYRLNVICSEVLEESILEIKKEQIGLDRLMFVISVLKDKDESMQIMDIMVKDKDLAEQLKTLDYRMFTISESNYVKMKFSENLDEYLEFFTENYYKDKDDAYRKMGAASRADMLFKLAKRSNHSFVLMYPDKDIKLNLLDLLKKHDSDYEIVNKDYDSQYKAVVVSNIGLSNDAMKYYLDVKAYLMNKLGDDYSKLKLMLITSDNYSLMFENKYLVEYLDFFKKYYKEEVKKEEIIDEYGFSYNEDIPHVFVINFSNKIDEKDLLSAFNDYNSKNLSVKIIYFDDSSKLLIVEGLANKKQAMMYYRAVLSNKNLYKALKKTSYSEFLISTDNYTKLSNIEGLNNYLNIFKKWYLN